MYNEDGVVVDTLFTDENGRFEYKKLKADQNYTFKPVNLTEDELVDFVVDIDVKSEETKGAFLYKKLPFSNQKVFVYNAAGEIVDSIITNDKGEFVFRKLKPDEEYTFKPVSINDSDLADFKINFLDIEDSNGPEKEVIKGIILIDGKPAPNRALVIIDENGFPIDTFYTDGTGKFEYFKLKGEYNYDIKPMVIEDVYFENIDLYLTDDSGKKTKAFMQSNTVVENNPKEVAPENKKIETIKTSPKESIQPETKQIIFFNFNEYTLTADDKTALNKVVSEHKLKNKITLIGHTDHIGDTSNNLKVAKFRAEAAKNYLINKGVEENQIKIVAIGESQPIADNKTPDGRAKNRRVEIVLN